MRRTIAFALSLGFAICSGSALAQDASKLYSSKCIGCHGSDGTGSSMGKKLGVHDFHSADVQGMSDDQLAEAIAKGKDKMPSYEKSLKPDEIKSLASYCKSLGKK